MSFNAGVRVKLGIALLIIYSFVSAGVLLKRQIRLRKKAHLDAAPHALRLRQLRRVLPARGTVGYLTDRQTPPNLEGQVLTQKLVGELLEFADSHFFLTQYELAPLILVPLVAEPTPPVVIGDFADPVEGAALRAAWGFAIDRDCFVKMNSYLEN